jgi:DNA-binding NarL/FixJ family response regulator
MRHILVADDHAVTRRGLRDLVDEIFPGAEVGEAVDGHELLAMIGSQDWDLLLLDALMPGPGFVPMLGEIRSLRPTIPLLVLTATTEIEYVVESMRAGANGLVRKSEADAELIRAVRLVADGGTYLHPETAAALARSDRKSTRLNSSHNPASRMPSSA